MSDFLSIPFNPLFRSVDGRAHFNGYTPVDGNVLCEFHISGTVFRVDIHVGKPANDVRSLFAPASDEIVNAEGVETGPCQVLHDQDVEALMLGACFTHLAKVGIDGVKEFSPVTLTYR